MQMVRQTLRRTRICRLPRRGPDALTGASGPCLRSLIALEQQEQQNDDDNQCKQPATYPHVFAPVLTRIRTPTARIRPHRTEWFPRVIPCSATNASDLTLG